MILFFLGDCCGGNVEVIIGVLLVMDMGNLGIFF